MKKLTRRVLPAVPALLLLTMAGCAAGAAKPGVAQGSTVPSPSVSASAGDAFARALAYAQCMRSHGVPDFPDPQHAGGGTRVTIGGDVNPNSPQFQSAQKACQSLQPDGNTTSGGDAVDATKIGPWTQCIRSHGVPNFPDPQNAGGVLRLNLAGTGVNPNSPQFQSAQKACQSLYPGGGMMVSAGGGS